MAGKLYIVPTPVGNLSDMTPRGAEILRTADLILAEDTRTSAILMKHLGIDTPMQSHHKYNEHATCEGLAARMAAGENVALISDAGTPGISDPGFMLSRECRRMGIDVVTLPGATAFVPALVSSGLPCDRFVFEGFLPPKKGRSSRIEALATDARTFIIYESPLRLVKTLQQLAEACGNDRPASVSREISKLHESTVRGTLGDLTAYFTANNPRGEIVIIVQGKTDPEIKVHKNKYRPEE
ncbi:MAG: 16S rRNA (cytidine(1402)-2'-O)-methyltransferase [Odoribacter sp.]|nr:16S rRNA (cytidine(1402)-2'-O)-methyltransferase [Odoribacter sp.]